MNIVGPFVLLQYTHIIELTKRTCITLEVVIITILIQEISLTRGYVLVLLEHSTLQEEKFHWHLNFAISLTAKSFNINSTYCFVFIDLSMSVQHIY